MAHTHASIRKDCMTLTRPDGNSGININRVWVERIGPVPTVSLGNVYVRVFSDGVFIRMGRFNELAKTILHEANRGA